MIIEGGRFVRFETNEFKVSFNTMDVFFLQNTNMTPITTGIRVYIVRSMSVLRIVLHSFVIQNDRMLSATVHRSMLLFGPLTTRQHCPDTLHTDAVVVGQT